MLPVGLIFACAKHYRNADGGCASLHRTVLQYVHYCQWVTREGGGAGNAAPWGRMEIHHVSAFWWLEFARANRCPDGDGSKLRGGNR